MYFATGAMHHPHQAPKAYIDKYRGRFDEGWDVVRERYYERQIELGIIPPGTRLPPSNPGVKPWEELGRNERNFVCRLQETWAGFLDHTDAQIRDRHAPSPGLYEAPFEFTGIIHSVDVRVERGESPR